MVRWWKLSRIKGGMLVIIDHGNEVITKYGNLDKDVEVTKSTG